MLYPGGLVAEAVALRHGQIGLTQRPACGIEAQLVAAPAGKGHRREAAGRIGRIGERLIEVFIDVEGVEGGIEGRIGWPEAQPLFGGRHQRLEVGTSGWLNGWVSSASTNSPQSGALVATTPEA